MFVAVFISYPQALGLMMISRIRKWIDTANIGIERAPRRGEIHQQFQGLNSRPAKWSSLIVLLVNFCRSIGVIFQKITRLFGPLENTAIYQQLCDYFPLSHGGYRFRSPCSWCFILLLMTCNDRLSWKLTNILDVSNVLFSYIYFNWLAWWVTVFFSSSGGICSWCPIIPS